MSITPLRELPLSHDFMFGEVMSQEKVCKLFLEALLGKKICRVKYIDRQKEFPGEYLYHGIRLDVYLEDDLGTVYNIEMQNSTGDDIQRRARYYQSGIDRKLLEKGEDYEDLHESYIIFVCSYDPFNAGLALYERVSVVKGKPDIHYEDGSHVFVLNSKFKTGNCDERICEFLQYLRTNNDTLPFSSELMGEVRAAVKRVQNDSTKEEKYMTLERKIADVRRESLREGQEKGIEKGRAESVKALMESMSFSFTQACEKLNISNAKDREAIRQYLKL